MIPGILNLTEPCVSSGLGRVVNHPSNNLVWVYYEYSSYRGANLWVQKIELGGNLPVQICKDGKRDLYSIFFFYILKPSYIYCFLHAAIWIIRGRSSCIFMGRNTE